MASLQKFLRLSDRVVEFKEYFISLPKDSHTSHALGVQKDEMIHLWDDLRTSYDQLLSQLQTKEEETDLVSIRGKYYAAFNAHLISLSTANELIDQLTAKPAVDNIDLRPIPNITLPPCDTDLFYGDYVSWPSFRDMFSALYKNNSRLTPVEKLCHLLKKTQGEARSILKTCPLTNEGFDMAWQNLVDRYENKRVLINAQLKTLLNLTPVLKESGPNIKNLQRTINDCISNLSLLNIETDNWDIIFVYIASTCLPNLTLNLWEQSLQSTTKLPSWREMDSFLTARYQTLESVADIRANVPSGTVPKPQSTFKSQNGKKFSSYHTQVEETPKRCTLCESSHPLRLCPEFLRLPTDQRLSVVKSQKRCTNCFATSHGFKKCKSKYTCSLCQQRHHTLLHRSENEVKPNQTQNSRSPNCSAFAPNPNASSFVVGSTSTQISTQENPSVSTAVTGFRQSYTTSLQSTVSDSIVLGTALVDVCLGDSRYTVRALVDPASEATFVSKPLQRRLSLPVTNSQVGVIGLNGALAATSNHTCPLTIGSPRDKEFTANVDAFVVRKLTGQLSYQPLLSVIKSQFSDLHLADQSYHHGDHVDILLGGDVYARILRDGVRFGSDNLLVAQHTVFGWIVTGKVKSGIPCKSVVSLHNEIALDHQLSRFWELEEVPNIRHISEDDTFCENLYKSTTFRNKDGRFVVSLPFKREFPHDITIGCSRHIAISQYLRNEARLNMQPQTKLNYDRVIDEYLAMGHMTQVNPDMSANGSTYYLPHHAVLKPESTTTKLRVVFNASSPSSNRKSLNDVLYPGPILQADLTILLLRWRLFRYVFNADIEKMYRQILVNAKHTPFQRIIYRTNPNENPKDFELNTVTFGVNCAPYLAIRTLIELAKQCEPESPAVSDILRNYMYVDDVLYGSHDLLQAIAARNDLIRVLNSAGFSLRKWTANHESLLQDIPPERLLDSGFLKLSDQSITKTLGLRWNAGHDYFYFIPWSQPDKAMPPTSKRAVLSEIAKLFDPAGWLAPKIIVAKIIMQEVWKEKTEWDKTIGTSSLKQWQAFLDDYINIGKIKIPRFVYYDPSYNIELHGFCDASEKAYAAALYIRSQTPDGTVITHLFAAKSKVAPVKFVTLPRKELCGAELLARLVDSLKEQLNLGKHRLYLWTDSMIVLAWLRKSPCHWKTFVANRVASIVEKVGNNVWSHVSSQDNPADLASRGIAARELIANDLWWKGPPWLVRPHSEWPICPSHLETEEEVRPIKNHLNNITETDILTRFSDLPKAMRVISYVFRFFHSTHPNHKQNFKYSSTTLCHTELKFVRSRLIVVSQQIHFMEYIHLSRGQVLPRKSSLLSLNPFIDNNGFLRVNGRLSQSPTLAHDEKFPVILPYSGRFTRLYLEMIHKISLHGENSIMLRLIRNEFWVPKLKNLIKTVIFNCKICVIQRHKRSQQIMASLPPQRTSLSRPFHNTGIDFAGPFDLKSYVGRGCKVTKGYVLVFVCFATKAIHLEITSEISTQAFLAAFARFFSRRGSPKAIYSDNGTAFVGAANILAKDRTQFLASIRQSLISQNAYQPLEWYFIPPGAPHMGGLWEAGVKSFKTHLKKIANAQKFTYEEFYTMLTRIEACLNSRPLSPMTDNAFDTCALTPGHFLIGSTLLSPPEPDCSHQSLSHANRWQKLKLLHHQFALRWKEEYLKELHKRIKWQYPQRNFAVGDLVVIRSENLPPTQWQLGRIEKVISGSDSKIRVAEVRTRNGILKRPIVKLVLLPNNEQS